MWPYKKDSTVFFFSEISHISSSEAPQWITEVCGWSPVKQIVILDSRENNSAFEGLRDDLFDCCLGPSTRERNLFWKFNQQMKPEFNDFHNAWQPSPLSSSSHPNCHATRTKAFLLLPLVEVGPDRCYRGNSRPHPPRNKEPNQKSRRQIQLCLVQTATKLFLLSSKRSS